MARAEVFTDGHQRLPKVKQRIIGGASVVLNTDESIVKTRQVLRKKFSMRLYAEGYPK